MAFTFKVQSEGPGLPDANSYVSREEAEDYLVIEGASSEWASLAAAEKDLMLARASRFIDRLAHFTGERSTDNQALEWPRVGAFDYSMDSETFDRSIKTEHVPEVLKIAVILLADDLASGEWDPKTAQTQDVNSVSLPDFSVSMKSGGLSQSVRSLPLPIRIVELLKPIAYNAWGPRMK